MNLELMFNQQEKNIMVLMCQRLLLDRLILLVEDMQSRPV